MSTTGASLAAVSSLNLEQLRRAVEELSSGVPPDPALQAAAQVPSGLRAPRSTPRVRAGSAGPNVLMILVLVALGALAVKLVLDRFSTSRTPELDMEDVLVKTSHAHVQEVPRPPTLPPQASRPQDIGPQPPRPQARTPEAPFDVQEFAPAVVGRSPAPPHVLGEHASRQDLVQFAKDHAAYYAAQGVPEPEAMLYISNKVREVVANQQRQRDAHANATAAAAANARAALPLAPVRAAQPQPALPLIMKLTGDVPIPGAPVAAREETDVNGRRKKVSSESKEVEEYMRRRQNALGIDAAPTDQRESIPASAPASALSSASPRTSSVSFQDPFETML